MNKRLILTPTRNEMDGMYQRAKELDGDILTLKWSNPFTRLFFPLMEKRNWWKGYDEVITLLYPMHLFGKRAKMKGLRWIVYDQKIPPTNLFKGVLRKMYMDVFTRLDKTSKVGADEYWRLDKIRQKPRWTEKIEPPAVFEGYRNWYFDDLKSFEDMGYALYVGRKTDYKNFDKLAEIMAELHIPFVTPPDNCDDETIHRYYSGAKMFVTASLWEGYGRPVSEAEALGIPAVAYDTGTHNKNIKKGICVPLGDEEKFKDAVKKEWSDVQS